MGADKVEVVAPREDEFRGTSAEEQGDEDGETSRSSGAGRHITMLVASQ